MNTTELRIKNEILSITPYGYLNPTMLQKLCEIDNETPVLIRFNVLPEGLAMGMSDTKKIVRAREAKTYITEIELIGTHVCRDVILTEKSMKWSMK